MPIGFLGFHRSPKPIEVDLGFSEDGGEIKSLSSVTFTDLKRASLEKVQVFAFCWRRVKAEFPNGAAIMYKYLNIGRVGWGRGRSRGRELIGREVGKKEGEIV